MTVYNLFTNPSFTANTTGWDGYTVGVVTGLVATLATGTNSVTLTSGTTSNMEVGQRLTKTSGTGVFGNSGVVYVKAITSSTVFTVGLADTTAQNHATLGSITFSAGATATLSLDSTSPLYGTGYSAKITALDSSPYIGILVNSSYRPSVIAGDIYTFSAYVKVPVSQATSDFKLRAYFYASSTLVSYSDSAPQKISSFDDWVRLTFTFTVPATATNMAGLVFRSTATTTSIDYNFLVDAVQFQTGSEATSLIYDQGQKTRLVDTSLTNVYIDHLTGMKLKADIRLGDFVFNRIDEYGVVWVVNDIEGWWGLPEVQVQDLPRGWGDGSYSTYGRFGSRQLTITGSFLIQDADTQLEDARARLIEAINLVKTDTWLILDEEIPKALKVRLSGTPSIATVNFRGKTDFSIGLVSADPIKYKWADAREDGYALATANSNAEVVTIRNEGNTPVSAVFEIIGSTTGPVSIFNRTSEELIDVIYKIDKYKSFTVSSTQVNSGNLVFTTANAHGFKTGDAVDILNVIDIFYIDSVVCAVTNSVDIITSVKHNFSAGQKIQLSGLSGLSGYGNVDPNVYTVTSVFTNSDDNKLRVTRSGLQISTGASQNPSDAKFSTFTDNLLGISYSSDNNIALISTNSAHGFRVGDQVVIANTSAVYDGTHKVIATPSTTTLELNIFNSQKIVEINTYESVGSLGTITFDSDALQAQAEDSITIEGVNEDFNGTYEVVSANSTAVTFNKNFSNSTPSTATSGTVYLSSLSTRSSVAYSNARIFYGNIYNGFYNVDSVPTNSSTIFKVIRPIFYNNVPTTAISTFYGSISNPAISRVYGETLSIDTYTREVALNGELGGYRSKLDTVVDWVQLQPGDNEIIFEDLNKNFASYVQYTHSTTTATITTVADHNFVVGSQVKLIGLNTVAGGSNVFANASTATIVTIPDTKSFTFTPTNTSGAADIASTAVTAGYIYEISSAFMNIYYRSGWIG